MINNKVDIKINGNIIQFHFEKQYDMCSTMIRIQEFYESNFSSIKGHYFELEEYMDLYSEKHGSFDYLDTIEGFNIPGDIARNFFEKFIGKLRKREQFLLDILNGFDAIREYDEFYIIATFNDGKDFNWAEAHEYCHAYYYLNLEYKLAMDNMTDLLPEEIHYKLTDMLSENFYSEDVFNDEIQAYMTKTNINDVYEMTKIDKRKLKIWMDKYNKIYDKFYGDKLKTIKGD